MKIKIIDNTKPIVDRVSGLNGHVASFIFTGNTRVAYNFQPNICHEETGTPVHTYQTSPELLDADGYVVVDVPTELIGNLVSDKHTKFSGMCVGIVAHKNGCLHAWVCKTGVGVGNERYPMQEFAIYDLEGDMIDSSTITSMEIVEKAKTGSPSHATIGSFV